MNLNSREQSRLENSRSAWPRWAAIAGGSALALFGISRRSRTGAALAAAGGLLAVGGTRIPTEPRELHAEATFTINVPPEEAFRYWINFENLPRFMSHLASVRVLGDRRSEWTMRGPLQMRIRWNAQIVDQRENQWIVWRSEPNAVLTSNGSVRFRPAPGNRGTEISVAIQYTPIAGPVGKALASAFGKNPSHIIREDLRHFKQLVETGEIATTFGQPHGRRSVLHKAKHLLLSDEMPKPMRGVPTQYRPEEVVA